MNRFFTLRLLLLWILIFGAYSSIAQSIPSSAIYHQLLRLKETKRVLYVAAHPDDENTRLIAYLVNGEHAEVGYLSLTRGDGGQNLIGKELGVELGQIRTQELIKARETDGGKQFFTRALDFGYSKNPDETLQNWDKSKVLADVVWAIRRFQPDIVITRFNTTPGITHGHHTTSAILAEEAFELAGKEDAFPEQLNLVEPWQPKRIFFNAYNFGGEFEPLEGKTYHVFPVGDFNGILGQSYSQISADSRTMHKSQGFGSTAGIGEAKDYIEFIKGEKFQNSPFDGVQDRWEITQGGENVKSLIEKSLIEFDFKNPASNLKHLIEIRKELKELDSTQYWIQEKREQVEQLIYWSLGVEAEWNASTEFGFSGQEISSEFVLNNSSDFPLKSIEFKVFGNKYKPSLSEIKTNKAARIRINFLLPGDFPLSQPYWMKEPLEGAMFAVSDQKQIGKPFIQNLPKGKLIFELEGEQFSVDLDLMYKFNDQVDGEIKQPFAVLPEIDLAISNQNLFLVSGADPTLSVAVNFRNKIEDGELEFLGLDSTQFRILSIVDLAAQKKRVFQIGFLPQAEGKKLVTARYITSEGKKYELATNRISYQHIPNLTYFNPASFNLIQADWKHSGQKIGYIPGAGDDVPKVLTELGYQVVMVGENDYSVDYLKQFKAVVLGVRAYNVNEELSANQQVLLGYVKSGGTLIVQYNTSSPLLTKQLGPFPFTIGRDRVTVQDSPVIADWAHPVLSKPNKIGAKDFDGWIQERGLYFATGISDQYSTPLEMQDPDETSSLGSLIYAKFGEGTYIYTGISFFRQLPAGVPGAIKLFINMIEQ
jgi:LmbE family N-acetylglucosaminyl deacetylase